MSGDFLRISPFLLFFGLCCLPFKVVFLLQLRLTGRSDYVLKAQDANLKNEFKWASFLKNMLYLETGASTGVSFFKKGLRQFKLLGIEGRLINSETASSSSAAVEGGGMFPKFATPPPTVSNTLKKGENFHRWSKFSGRIAHTPQKASSFIRNSAARIWPNPAAVTHPRSQGNQAIRVCRVVLLHA